MKKKSPGLTVLFLWAEVSLLTEIYTIGTTAGNGQAEDPGFLPWCICLLLCTIILSELLQTQRDSRLLVQIEAAFFGLQALSYVLLYGIPAGMVKTAFLLGTWLLTYVRLYEAVTEGVDPAKLEVLFNGTVLAGAMAVFLFSARAQTRNVWIPPAASLLLTLAALAGVRSPEEEPTGRRRSIGMLTGLVGILGAIAALLVAGTGKVLGRGAKMLGSALLDALRWIGRILGRVMEWLLSLLPETEIEEALPAEERTALPAMAQEEMADVSGVLGAVLLLVLGVLLAAFIIHVLRHGTKQGERRIAAAFPVRRKRVPLRDRMARWWNRLRGRITWLACCVIHRNTVPGVYIWLERRSGRRRQKNETCRSYLQQLCRQWPTAEQEIQVLADAMDSRLFGTGTPYPPDSARTLRKAVRTAMAEDRIRASRAAVP